MTTRRRRIVRQPDGSLMDLDAFDRMLAMWSERAPRRTMVRLSDTDPMFQTLRSGQDDAASLPSLPRAGRLPEGTA